MTKCLSIYCPIRASCRRSISKEYENEKDFYVICNENSKYPNYIPVKNEKQTNVIRNY